MTSKFEDFEQDQSVGSLNSELADPTDSFELLSAYLDGELSPTQRHQVQTWIDQDLQVKALYTQLLTLQSQIQALKAPSDQKTAGEIAEQVFQTVENRRRQRRLRLGFGVIAASCLATITSLLPGAIPRFQVAQSFDPSESEAPPVMLAVALNKPAIDIPKVAPDYSLEQTASRKNQI